MLTQNNLALLILGTYLYLAIPGSPFNPFNPCLPGSPFLPGTPLAPGSPWTDSPVYEIYNFYSYRKDTPFTDINDNKTKKCVIH